MLLQPPQPLKCLSFNLLHGGPLSGRVGPAQHLERRLEIVIQELQSLNVDIIGLQEASSSRGRGNIAARIAAQLGFQYVYAPSSSRVFASEKLNTAIARVMNFTEGPAIVSRFPILHSQVYDIPHCGLFPNPRVLLRTQLQTPWGQLWACSTHISSDPCQAYAVAQLLHDQYDSLPLIVMGDFNAQEHSSNMTHLIREAGLIDTFRTANPITSGCTVDQHVYASHPTAFGRVNYVFLRPGANTPGQTRTSRIVLNTPRRFPDGQVLWPSDHYGVLTEADVFSSVIKRAEERHYNTNLSLYARIGEKLG